MALGRQEVRLLRQFRVLFLVSLVLFAQLKEFQNQVGNGEFLQLKRRSSGVAGLYDSIWEVPDQYWPMMSTLFAVHEPRALWHPPE
jgi:hypothetical protein